MMNSIANDRIGRDTSDETILAYDFSDDSLERAADPDRLYAVTLAFCSGLDTCPS